MSERRAFFEVPEDWDDLGLEAQDEFIRTALRRLRRLTDRQEDMSGAATDGPLTVDRARDEH